jgi:hypothetical protein
MRLGHRSGVLRISEAMLAAGTIVTALLIATTFARSPNPLSSRYGYSLEKVAYDVLDVFAREGVPDAAMFDESGKLLSSPRWEQSLKVTLQGLLPRDIVFDLEVYNVTYDRANNTTQLVKLNSVGITNAQSEKAFVESGNVANALRPYTCRKFWVLVLKLTLAEMGGR